MDNELQIDNLHVSVDDKEIIRGVTLNVKQGEVHAIMGPNGSGKSTLAQTLLGHPRYKVDRGSIRYRGEEVLRLNPEERANLGLFLSFQYPMEVPGVSFTNFLRTAFNHIHRSKDNPITAVDFVKLLREKAELLGLKEEFFRRPVNEGFSGGEKKKSEIFQMAVLQPKIAVLDETDSGLDIDALKIVAEGVNKLRSQRELESPRSGPGILLITHYQRILNFVQPDFVHVLVDGKIVTSGDRSLALRLEEKGYGWIAKDAPTTPVASRQPLLGQEGKA